MTHVITVVSKKWGTKSVLIDAEDLHKLQDRTVGVISYNNGGTFYAVLHIRKSKYLLLHRVIMGVTNSNEIIDHVNRDPLDNRKVNLRSATRLNNSHNSKGHSDNSSGYKGVSLHKKTGKFQAQIQFNYIKSHLGYFSTKEEAAKAYNQAASRLHGKFAALNDIEGGT